MSAESTRQQFDSGRSSEPDKLNNDEQRNLVLETIPEDFVPIEESASTDVKDNDDFYDEAWSCSLNKNPSSCHSLEKAETCKDEFPSTDIDQLEDCGVEYSNSVPNLNKSLHAVGRKKYVSPDSGASMYIPVEPKWKCPFNLPYGYEVGISDNFQLYFINHVDYIVSNTYPTGIYPPERVRKNLSYTENTSSEFEKLTVVIHRKDFPDFGFTVRRGQMKHTCIVNFVNKNGPSHDLLRKNDTIISINKCFVAHQLDVDKCCEDKLQIEIEFFRVQDRSSKTMMETKVSSILSEERKKIIKAKGLHVHFSDVPLVSFKKGRFFDHGYDENVIEKTFDYILKVTLETGVVKTIKVRPKETVGELVKDVMGKLMFTKFDGLTLALTNYCNANNHFYELSEKVTNVLEWKKTDNNFITRILFINWPTDMNAWHTKEYRPNLCYLYYQLKNSFLRGDFILRKKSYEEKLWCLVSYVTATQFYMDTYPTLQRFVRYSDSAVENSTNSKKFLYSKYVKQLCLDPNCQLNSIYRSITDESVRKGALHTIQDAIPVDIRELICADIESLEAANCMITPEKYDDIDYLGLKLQAGFISSAILLSLVGCYRFRVHVSEAQRLNKNTHPVVGIPFNFFIDHKDGYGIENNTTGFYKSFGNFNSLIGIVVAYHFDKRKFVSIYSKKNEPLILICTPQVTGDILLIMSRMYSSSSETHKKELSIIDLTSKKMRLPSFELPRYNARHITLPSRWNQNSSIKKFFIAIQHSLRGTNASDIRNSHPNMKFSSNPEFDRFAETFEHADLPRVNSSERMLDYSDNSVDDDSDPSQLKALSVNKIFADELEIRRGSILVSKLEKIRSSSIKQELEEQEELVKIDEEESRTSIKSSEVIKEPLPEKKVRRGALSLRRAGGNAGSIKTKISKYLTARKAKN